MSLVNDMLKDLDKRQAPDQNPAPAAAGYGSLTQEGNNRNVIIAVLLLVCVLLVAGAVSVWLFKDQLLAIIDSEKTEPSAVSTVENSPMTSEVDAPIPATEKVSASNELPEEEKVLEDLDSSKVVVVNETAEEKTSEEKVDNNMSGASGKVVDADPLDTGGVEKVQVEKIRAETVKVEKAKESKPKNTAVDKTKPEIAQTPTKQKSDIVEPSTSIKAQAVKTKVVKNKVVKTKVVKTPEQIDGEVIAKAADYLRAGNKVQAVSLLRQHISTASLHDRSSEMLVMVFSQSRQFEEANQLIERFPVSHASLAMQLKARVLLAQGNTGEAIAVLEQKLPELSEHPDHHVMLAAFYQQSGRYNEAASVYASLIAHDESEGNWWAGLGIALEGSNQLEGAKRAYQRALKLRSLNTDLANYVSSRLVQMNGS